MALTHNQTNGNTQVSIMWNKLMKNRMVEYIEEKVCGVGKKMKTNIWEISTKDINRFSKGYKTQGTNSKGQVGWTACRFPLYSK